MPIVEKILKTALYQFGKGKNIQFYQKCIHFYLKNFLLSPEMKIIWSKARQCEHVY